MSDIMNDMILMYLKNIIYYIKMNVYTRTLNQ